MRLKQRAMIDFIKIIILHITGKVIFIPCFTYIITTKYIVPSEQSSRRKKQLKKERLRRSRSEHDVSDKDHTKLLPFSAKLETFAKKIFSRGNSAQDTPASGPSGETTPSPTKWFKNWWYENNFFSKNLKRKLFDSLSLSLFSLMSLFLAGE